MQIGLYVHFPFCRNHCSYCDFYKETYDLGLERRFFDALRIETETASDDPAVQTASVDSIFIGGGTPSLANLDLLADWLAVLKRHFDVPEGIEFSIECNPESVTRESLTVLKELGVNRPVFGVQSFDAKALKVLGRRHAVADSHRAVYLANALGFDNFGLDLIFGLPGQNSRKLSSDIDQVIGLEPKHVSFYQLTVEPGTPLAQRVDEATVRIPDNDLTAGFYRGGTKKLSEAGYDRYEVSSFAQPGYECRHNVRYWEGGAYLGLGPSAHSFIGDQRFANVADLSVWLESLAEGRLPRQHDQSGLPERIEEAIMLGLRTARGIDRASFRARFGSPLERHLDREEFARLVESGHVVPDRGFVRLSEEGIFVADEITRRLTK